jgi:hypothetical protein
MTSDPLTSTWLYAVAGVLVLVALCAALMFWLTRRRRRRTVNVSMHRLGDQPLLRCTDRPGASARRKFAEEFQVGTEVPVTIPTQDGGQEQHIMRVSRLSRVRGEQDGRVGVVMQAYLERFEGTELPVELPVTGGRGVQRLRIDEDGVTALGAERAEVWSSGWRKLTFVNSVPSDDGPKLVLRAADYSELHIATNRGAGDYAEGLVCKYGRLAHRDSWGREPGTLGTPATPNAD